MVGVPPCQRLPQVPLFTQTGMPKYDLFSKTSFSDSNFPENDNQTFNVYVESTLSIYTERACVVFPGFEIHHGRVFV